jgi:RING finger protein 113A
MDQNKIYCLPFKKTGFCKYGDNCKYLHLRDVKEENNKCNWCLEKEDVLVAECGHSFCEGCATTSCDCRVCGEKGGLYAYRN